MPCTVCTHPQLLDIELALLAGDTLKSLHERYGPSPSSLQRHKKHLESKMHNVRYRLDNRQDQGCLLQLNDILNLVQQGIKTAAANDETDRIFRGAAIASRIIHQMHQMQVEWETDTVYRLTSPSAAASLDSLLPIGPGALYDLNQAFLAKASSPCPEPEDQDDAEAGDAAAEAAPVDPDLETQRLGALAQLQQLLPRLDLSLDDIPPPENEKPKMENGFLETDNGLLKPANERQTTEKSPAKTAPQTDNVEEKQEDITDEKYLPANAVAVAKTDFSSNQPHAENEKPNGPLTPSFCQECSFYPNTCFADPSLMPPDACLEKIKGKQEKEEATSDENLFSPNPDSCHKKTENGPNGSSLPTASQPKPIPNRRVLEDIHSNSVFGDPSKIWG